MHSLVWSYQKVTCSKFSSFQRRTARCALWTAQSFVGSLSQSWDCVPRAWKGYSRLSWNSIDILEGSWKMIENDDLRLLHVITIYYYWSDYWSLLVAPNWSTLVTWSEIHNKKGSRIFQNDSRTKWRAFRHVHTGLRSRFTCLSSLSVHIQLAEPTGTNRKGWSPWHLRNRECSDTAKGQRENAVAWLILCELLRITLRQYLKMLFQVVMGLKVIGTHSPISELPTRAYNCKANLVILAVSVLTNGWTLVLLCFAKQLFQENSLLADLLRWGFLHARRRCVIRHVGCC